MKISVSEDIYIDGMTIKDLITKLDEISARVGADATIEFSVRFESVESTVEYIREETGPEQSKRIHKELAQKESRRVKYVELSKEFNTTSGVR